MRLVNAHTDRYWRVLWTVVLVVALSTQVGAPPVSASPVGGADVLASSTVDAATARAQGGGFELWMTNQRRNSIQVVRDETLIEEIDLGGLIRVPHIVRFSPSGHFAYLASVGAAGDIASASTMVIRSSDRAVVATLPTGPGTHDVSPSPDGKQLIVAVGGFKVLTEIVVDEATEGFKLGRQLELASHPLVTAAGLEGQPVCAYYYAPRKAYVGFHHGGAVLLDADAFELTRVYSKADVAPNRCAMLPLPDGKLLIGSGTETDGGYAVWDPTTETFVTKINTTQADNHGGAVRPGTSEAWFVARGSDSLTIIGTEGPYPIREILHFGDAPDHLVFSPDGTRAFITLRGPEPLTGGPVAVGQTPGLAIVDAETHAILKIVGLEGGDPHWVALRPLP